jgi:hemoglobin-like flavoprotein
MMDPRMIMELQSSWKKVMNIAPAAAKLFYDNLFEADPSLKPLFKSKMEEQGMKLMETINTAVSMLENLPQLVPILQALAKRHVMYGAKPEHYPVVGAALIKTLGQGLGDEFTDGLRTYWTEIYGVISSVMIEAAYPKAADNKTEPEAASTSASASSDPVPVSTPDLNANTAASDVDVADVASSTEETAIKVPEVALSRLSLRP